MNSDQDAQGQPKSPATGARFFDVVHPGQTPAHPSSRPVIVGHRPRVQDSMVGGTASPIGDAQTTPRRPMMSAATRISIVPKSDPVTDPAADIITDTAVQPEELTPSAPQTTPPAQPTHEDIISVGSAATDAAVMGGVSTPEPSPAAETQENTPAVEPTFTPTTEPEATPTATVSEDPQANRESAIVSHHGYRMRWWEILLIALSIILIAVIALDILLDTGVINVPDSVPHTDFF